MASGSPQTKKIERAFSGGLAQQFHARHAPEGAALEATNVRFSREGALSRRKGLETIGTVDDAVRLGSRGNALLAFDEVGGVHAYSAATDAFADKGVGLSVPVTRREVGGGGNDILYQSVAVHGGVRIVVWAGTYNASTRKLWVALIDEDTGAEISVESIYDDPTTPRVCTLTSGYTVIAWGDGTSIYASILDSNFAWAFQGAVVVNASARSGSHLAICAYDFEWLLLYEDGATAKPYLKRFLNTTLQDSRLLNHGAAGNKIGFGLDAVAGENIWASWIRDSGNDTAHVSCINPTSFVERAGFPFTVFTPLVIPNACYATAPKRLSSTTAVVAITGEGTAYNIPYTLAPVVNSSGAVVGSADAAARRTWHTYLASAPFVDANGRCLAYLAVANGPTSYALADLGASDTSSSNLQAKPVSGLVAPRFATDYGVAVSLPSAVATTSTTYAAMGVIRKSNNGRLALTMMEADTADTDRFACAEMGDATYSAPGGMFDGQLPYEHGFTYPPAEIYASSTAGSGGHLGAGIYWWVISFAMTDRNGNIHRSAFSEPFTDTALANDVATLTVPNYCFTRRHDTDVGQEVEIEVWRTLVDGDSAGPFYRWSPGAGYQNGAMWRNDPTTHTRTIVDSVADSFIEGNETYYPGVVLPNVAPPSYKHPCAYRGRLCVVGDDGQTVYASKAWVEGECVNFADALTVPRIDESETITAMRVLDDYLIAWTRSRIYWNAFDGPGDAGGVSDIGPWKRITADVGCTDARSITAYQGGLVFQSDVGLQLLTRNRSVQVPFFGQAVQNEALSYPYVLSAATHPSEGTLLFCVSNNPQGSGAQPRLVFDYQTGKWSKDNLSDAMHSQLALAGEMYLLGATGDVYREEPTAWLDFDDDSETWVESAYTTSWEKPLGSQGFFRPVKLLLLAEWRSNHRLTVDVYADYNDATPIEQWDLSSVNVERLSEGTDVVQFSRAFRLIQIQAFKLRFRVLEPSTSVSTAEAVNLVSWLVEVDPVDQVPRLPAAKKG